MPHDSHGHIYKLAGTGVQAMDDIRAVVGGLNPSTGKYEPVNRGNINKWSRHKPVIFASLDALEDSEFRGQAAQINAGYIYGVKICGTNQKILPSLHTDITEEYLRPSGAMPSEPHRYQDFNDYYHEAQPSPKVAYDWLPGQTLIAFKDTAEGLNVTLAFNDSEGGIDIIEEMAASAGSVYVCGMISKGSLCYAAALKNTTTGTVTPVFYQNAWQRMFHADFRNIQAQLAVAAGYTFSCFLVVSSSSPEALPLDGDWHAVPELGFSQRPWDAPEGMNRALEVQQLTIDPPVFRIATHPMSAQGVSINMTWDKVDTDKIGWWQAEVAYNGIEAPAKRGQFDPNGDLRTAIAPVDWSEFGLVERPTTGTIRVTMRTGWAEGAYNKTNTQEFSVAG